MVRCDWLRALCSAPCAHAPSGVGGGGGGVSTVSKAALQPVKMCFRIPMPLLESRVNEARLVRGPEVAHFIVRAAPTQIGLWAPDGHGVTQVFPTRPKVLCSPSASRPAARPRPPREASEADPCYTTTGSLKAVARVAGSLQAEKNIQRPHWAVALQGYIPSPYIPPLI